MQNLIALGKTLFAKHKKFVLFCLVGLMNSILSVLIYNALMWAGLHYNLAYAIAFALTLINSFYWNGTKVFRGASKAAAVKYFAVYMTSFLLGSALLQLLVEQLHLHKTLAQLPVIAFGTIFNYLGSRLWVFRTPKDRDAQG